MPRANIYIRKVDTDKWDSIEDKPEFIHTSINNLPENQPFLTDRNKDMDFCKHNSVKGLCKKGCK